MARHNEVNSQTPHTQRHTYYTDTQHTHASRTHGMPQRGQLTNTTDPLHTQTHNTDTHLHQELMSSHKHHVHHTHITQTHNTDTDLHQELMARHNEVNSQTPHTQRHTDRQTDTHLHQELMARHHEVFS